MSVTWSQNSAGSGLSITPMMSLHDKGPPTMMASSNNFNLTYAFHSCAFAQNAHQP